MTMKSNSSKYKSASLSSSKKNKIDKLRSEILKSDDTELKNIPADKMDKLMQMMDEILKHKSNPEFKPIIEDYNKIKTKDVPLSTFKKLLAKLPSLNTLSVLPNEVKKLDDKLQAAEDKLKTISFNTATNLLDKFNSIDKEHAKIL